MQIWVNILIVQLSMDARMSVLLLGSSHINRLKYYVNKLQQEFNLDGNVIKLFGINGGRIGFTYDFSLIGGVCILSVNMRQAACLKDEVLKFQ